MNENWKTSSRSVTGETCVEASGPWSAPSRSRTVETCAEVSSGAVVRVRDTKARERGHFAVGGQAWTCFLDGMAK